MPPICLRHKLVSDSIHLLSPTTVTNVHSIIHSVKINSVGKRTNFSDRVFSAAGTRVWNYLPTHFRQAGLIAVSDSR